MAEPDPFLIFESLPNTVDLWTVDVPLNTKADSQPVGATAHLVITTNGFVYSYFDPDDQSKVLDYFWLGHQCALDHPESADVRGLDSFQLTVAQLPLSPAAQQDIWSDGTVDLTAPAAVAAALGVPAANLASPQGSVLKSDPQAAGSVQSYTSSMSQTVGANAGFFGDTPTGGVSTSNTASNDVVTNVPALTIFNFTQSAYAAWSWEPTGGDPFMSSFQPYAQAIAMSHDDGSGARAARLDAADPRSDRYAAFVLAVGFQYEYSDDNAAVAAASRIFKIPLPPLPKPAAQLGEAL